MIRIKIAIDGPGASGKSTLGRMMAEHLGFTYIDSGAMYRAVALKALERQILLDDSQAVVDVASGLTIRFEQTTVGQRLLVNDADVTEAIRTPEVAQGASKVSAIPGVRRILVKRQQEMGRHGGIVMDGRDIGTVVFPDAEVKIYLDASVEERARRRCREDQNRGIEVDLQRTEQEIDERDGRDKNRLDSPLREAEDAVLIDTSGMTIKDVYQRILEIIQPRLQ